MKLILALLLSCSLCWATIDDNRIMPKWNKEDISTDPKPCCLPKRWRGIVGDLVGFKGRRGSGSVRAMAEVFTDMGLGKVACFETVMIGGRAMNITAVADYKKQVMYIVTGRSPNKCHKVRLPKSQMSQCLPKTAKYVGSPAIGWGSGALKVNAFHFNMRTKKVDAFVEISVTTNGCAPVSEAGMVATTSIQKMFSVGFYDLKPDIPDPKVFDPPKVCQNATVFDTEADLTDLQDYLFNVRFTM